MASYHRKMEPHGPALRRNRNRSHGHKLYGSDCMYNAGMSMKTKRRRKTLPSGRVARIWAAADQLRRSPAMAEMYRPIKKPVTLRLDADVIAWFKARGRGYQTRMNRALRAVMLGERKA